MSEQGLPACCSKASRQQPQHVPAPAPTRSAGRKPGKDSGSYRRPPDLLFLQALPQAAFAPDAEALAESNLKGFANTSMVLIETNIHQSAPCSESTSSAKDHLSPAGLDTVPQQQCRSRLAAGSLLPAMPKPRPPSQPGHHPSRHTAAMGPRRRRGRGEVKAAGGHERTPHHRNVPCGTSTHARVGNGVGGLRGHQAKLLCVPVDTCVGNKAPRLRDHRAGEETESRAVGSLLSRLVQPPA